MTNHFVDAIKRFAARTGARPCRFRSGERKDDRTRRYLRDWTGGEDGARASSEEDRLCRLPTPARRPPPQPRLHRRRQRARPIAPPGAHRRTTGLGSPLRGPAGAPPVRRPAALRPAALRLPQPGAPGGGGRAVRTVGRRLRGGAHDLRPAPAAATGASSNGFPAPSVIGSPPQGCASRWPTTARRLVCLAHSCRPPSTASRARVCVPPPPTIGRSTTSRRDARSRRDRQSRKIAPAMSLDPET